MAFTEFSVAASGDDGRSYGEGDTYPPTVTASPSNGANVSVDKFKAASSPLYRIAVGLIRFDTASLPDAAVIDSAILRLYLLTLANDDARNFVIEYYDAGTIGNEDYSSTVVGDAHAGTSISSLTINVTNDFALIGLSGINRTGYTGFRLHISGGVPGGSSHFNIVDFVAFDHATLVEPRLLVTYDSAGGGGGGHRELTTLRAG